MLVAMQLHVVALVRALRRVARTCLDARARKIDASFFRDVHDAHHRVVDQRLAQRQIGNDRQAERFEGAARSDTRTDEDRRRNNRSSAEGDALAEHPLDFATGFQLHHHRVPDFFEEDTAKPGSHRESSGSS